MENSNKVIGWIVLGENSTCQIKLRPDGMIILECPHHARPFINFHGDEGAQLSKEISDLVETSVRLTQVNDTTSDFAHRQEY